MSDLLFNDDNREIDKLGKKRHEHGQIKATGVSKQRIKAKQNAHKKKKMMKMKMKKKKKKEKEGRRIEEKETNLMRSTITRSSISTTSSIAFFKGGAVSGV